MDRSLKWRTIALFAILLFCVATLAPSFVSRDQLPSVWPLNKLFGNQISLEQAAYSVGISPNRLSRLFCEETGNGFSDFLIDYRIERAKELLAVPGASIKQVSMQCGYPDPNYFSRLFKKVTGLTPTAFSSGATEALDGRA